MAYWLPFARELPAVPFGGLFLWQLDQLARIVDTPPPIAPLEGM